MVASLKPGLRRFWLILGWLWVAGVFWLSLTPMPPQPLSFDFADKLEHLLGYASLMSWFSVLYRDRQRLICAILLVVMGVLIEVLQGVGGYRYFEFSDMVANTAGVLLAAWAMHHAGDGILRKVKVE